MTTSEFELRFFQTCLVVTGLIVGALCLYATYKW